MEPGRLSIPQQKMAMPIDAERPPASPSLAQTAIEASSNEQPPPDMERPSDEAIMQQQASIKHEIQKNTPLLGEIQEFRILEQEYAGNENAPTFLDKINQLAPQYAGYQPVRGDGNCFYRAYLFSVFDLIASEKNQQEAQRLLDFANCLQENLVSQGLSEVAVEMFCDEFLSEVEWLTTFPSRVELEAKFRDEASSPYFVYIGRFIVSGYLREHSDMFLPYLGGKSLQQFVEEEVEPVDREADHVQCAALAQALEIPLRVQYLDAQPGKLVYHDMPEGRPPRIHLLYRPGHYDILTEK